MKYLNTILVKDELQNRKLMEQLLSSYCPTVRLIAQCGSFAEAKKVLPTTPADLLFLDIELDRGNSLELLEAIDLGETQVIFVTAHKEYAIELESVKKQKKLPLSLANEGDYINEYDFDTHAIPFAYRMEPLYKFNG